MSTSTHCDVFTDIVNNLMRELHAHSVTTILPFLINNLNSPVLAKIQHLSLFDLDPNQMTALLPALAKMVNLTSLALPYCAASPNHFQFLTECSALSNLQSLDLRYVQELTSEDLHLLSQSTILTKLTSLTLMGCNVTTSRAAVALSQQGQDPTKDSSGLVALLSSGAIQHLTHLNLGYTDIDDSLVHVTIATSPFLSNLASLNLSHTRINSDAVAAFAASTTLTNLTHLNISWNPLGEELVAQLFSPQVLLAQKLQSLDLSWNDITVSSLQVMSTASPDLSELILKANRRLNPAGESFIAASMPNLTKLDLSQCNISNQGYVALAASTTLFNLRELHLDFCPAQAESIIALVNSPVMANLTKLDLGYTYKGPDVLVAIAQSPSMSKLRHLGFCGNEAGDAGVTALAQSTTSTNLTWMDLSNSGIGPNGVNALCTSSVATKLTHLNLGGNDMGNSVAVALAAPSSTLYNLVELNLWGTKMDDQGVLQLLGSPNLDQLNILKVQGNTTKSSTKAVYRTRFDGSI